MKIILSGEHIFSEIYAGSIIELALKRKLKWTFNRNKISEEDFIFGFR